MSMETAASRVKTVRLIEKGDPKDDSRAFRRCLGQYATGVAVVTCCTDGRRYGMTINSFAAVSLDPPIVLWSLRKESKVGMKFMEAEHFAFSVLSTDQVEVAHAFSAGRNDPFGEVRWSQGSSRSPLIDEAIAHLECRRIHVYEAGDHYILLGEVEQFGRYEGGPLLFAQGQYAASRSHPSLPSPAPQPDAVGAGNADFSFVKLLSAASLQMSAGFEAQRRALDLTTASARILNRLLESPRAPDALERITFLGHDAMNDALADLGSRELVSTQQNGWLELTPRGEKAAEALAVCVAEFNREKTRGIPDEDLATVLRVLQRLARIDVS